MKSIFRAAIVALLMMLIATTEVHAKGGLGDIFGVLVGKAVGGVAGKAIVDTPTMEGILQKMSSQINQQLPMNIDKQTRLDNLTPGPGRRFTYNYTMVAVAAIDVDKTYFHGAMQSKLRNSVCSTPEMEVFFKNGVTLGYSYRAADSVFITKIDITPKDCGFGV